MNGWAWDTHLGAFPMQVQTRTAVTISSSARIRWVGMYPNQSTNRGVKKADSAVPPIPAPKTPVAKPRRESSYQLLTSGIPTAKTVPATPSSNAHNTRIQ